MNDLVLHNTISQLFDRIALLNGVLYHLERTIVNYSSDYVQSWESSKHEKPKYAMMSRLVLSDISGPTDNGWFYHYPTSSEYLVGMEDYEEKTHQLITQFSHFTIAQSYEAFETYIKDILAAELSLNPKAGHFYFDKYLMRTPLWSRILQLLRIRKTPVINPEKLNWKSEVRKFPSGRKNKTYFKILRDLIGENSKFEIDNNYGMDLKKWYTLLSKVRHAITHSKNLISLSEISDSTSKEMLKEYFPGKIEHNCYKLDINKDHASRILKIIAEYSFQIFKYLAMNHDFDWKIMANMEANYKD